jgi:hypothetical protein
MRWTLQRPGVDDHYVHRNWELQHPFSVDGMPEHLYHAGASLLDDGKKCSQDHVKSSKLQVLYDSQGTCASALDTYRLIPMYNIHGHVLALKY